VKLFDVRSHGHGSSPVPSSGQPETSLRPIRMPKIDFNSPPQRLRPYPLR
jgi:hypothetical protein